MDGIDLKQVIDLASANGPNIESFKVEGVGDVHVAFVPRGAGAVELIDLKPMIDKWRDGPLRREGTATAATLDSFVELVNRHKDEDSAVFAEITADKPVLTAVIDYNTTAHKPRFGKHRVKYQYPISPEWKAWLAADRTTMDQGKFAEWIEEHIVEIGDPEQFRDREDIETMFHMRIADAAEIYTLSKGLQINIESEVKGFTDLASGQVQIGYVEQHKDGAGQPLRVPGLFLVTIPFFVGADPVTLVARLRYRKNNQKLIWFYELWKWDTTMRKALLADLDKVRAETALPVFEGSPEA
jgi:uncharacterized protein YfdQ (DUF2303 family)